MTWLVALIFALVILYLIPVRLVNLYRKGLLTESSFAWTFVVGWCLAILAVFYLGLADVLVARHDAVLGLAIAGVNFALGYPIARLFYRHVLAVLLKRFVGELTKPPGS